MNLLEEIAQTFTPSRAVFNVKVVDGGRSIDFNVKDQAVHMSDPHQDPIRYLVSTQIQEKIDTGARCFRVVFNYHGVISTILRSIQEFVVRSSPLKNPRQAKLYKWLDNIGYDYDDEHTPGFIALYKYMAKNWILDPSNNTIDIRSNDPHVKNAVAILELMRAKYDKS